VSSRFWSGLLGWEFQKIDAAPIDIWTIRNAGRPNGSMRRMGDETPSDVPPHWLVYFAAVESLEAAADTVGSAGGQTLVPKTQAGPGNSFAIFSDSAGATFGLFEGQLDD
jgi:predicted enzyme related to lactoylglutathione lyase